jgi:hypothetical protein
MLIKSYKKSNSCFETIFFSQQKLKNLFEEVIEKRVKTRALENHFQELEKKNTKRLYFMNEVGRVTRCEWLGPPTKYLWKVIQIQHRHFVTLTNTWQLPL